MDAELIKHWDASSERIPDTKEHSGYARSVETEFPRGSRIIDIGGGKGEDASYLITQGHAVHIVDISPKALAAARNRVERLGVAEGLQTTAVNIYEQDLPLEDSSADVVYSRLALHYGTPEQTTKALQEIWRILRPEGQAFIVVKSPSDEQEMAYLKSTAHEVAPHVFQDGVGVKSRFTKDQWQEILSNAGIQHFDFSTYTEDLSNKNDTTRSGNLSQDFTQIRFKK